MRYENGLPVFEVPLPSRNETCQFILKPVGDTVTRFCDYIKCEDKGIELVNIYSSNGSRIAGSTSVGDLLIRGNFRLRINDMFYIVEVPSLNGDKIFHRCFAIVNMQESDTGYDKMQKFDDIKCAVAYLHSVMNVEEYKALRERILLEKYETVQAELKPLLEAKARIDTLCKKRAQRVLWITFGAMGFQAGFFGRLTWWEYSWDIMEPVTYFTTYASLIASFAYYIYTNQVSFFKALVQFLSYDYNEHKRRAISLHFHKKATKNNFDISRFNELQNAANSIKLDLKRLRDPLYQGLPTTNLTSLLKSSEEISCINPSKEFH
ncbi:unnamed protein product [Thelazia callipaeda]|uniref:Calcium uniporter protein n=1 Tax=Thelazia callipaeda TaxID=103827 RepID=A0A158RBJ3_THECL|nr:unnamed protein product [Thelazia callipaeda]